VDVISGIEIPADRLCLKQFAVNVGKDAKFLFARQGVNLFIVATVFAKKMILDHQIDLVIEIMGGETLGGEILEGETLEGETLEDEILVDLISAIKTCMR
jgi:hypothetical protein